MGGVSRKAVVKNATAFRAFCLSFPLFYGIIKQRAQEVLNVRFVRETHDVYEVYKMNEKARSAKNAYHRAWAKRNPEKVKAQQERYWERQAEKAQQSAAATVPAIPANV